MSIENRLDRLIAFYLPQFHPIPENDEWWGKGFTEWRMVANARSLFKGHYQPHIPADLGFYDLRLSEVRETQAEIAKKYGIFGFCYYHYWFNGKRVLERPFNDVLALGKPDFPFCLCWANENWTRVWDGGKDHILLNQNYSFEDDRAHIESIIPAFRDERYIRVDGKPLFLVYRTELLSDPNRTADIWRETAARSGLGDLYLVRVESFTSDINPKEIGFDASTEFAPDWKNTGKLINRSRFKFYLSKLVKSYRVYFDNHITEYQSMIDLMLRKSEPDYIRFRCATPMWDNSPRREKNAAIFVGATPEKYKAWLQELIRRTLINFKGDEQIIFINAWNEWGEGNHLEPDQKWGRAYLEATYGAINGATQDITDQFSIKRSKKVNRGLYEKANLQKDVKYFTHN